MVAKLIGKVARFLWCKACLVLLASAALASCSSGERAESADWKDRALFAQVGEEIYELKTGRLYSLGGMEDEEINDALARGMGTQLSPLKIRSLMIGEYDDEGNSLIYDIVVVDSDDKLLSESDTRISAQHSQLKTVELRQSLDAASAGQPLRRTIGNLILNFEEGETLRIPTECYGSIYRAEFRSIFCSSQHFHVGSNQFSIQSRRGHSENDIERHFYKAFQAIDVLP